jgi:hypothetical protein
MPGPDRPLNLISFGKVLFGREPHQVLAAELGISVEFCAAKLDAQIAQRSVSIRSEHREYVVSDTVQDMNANRVPVQGSSTVDLRRRKPPGILRCTQAGRKAD